MSGKVIAILLLSTVLGGAAVYYYERQIVLLQQLGYQIIGYKLGQDLSMKQAQITLTVRISSTSTLDAQVKGLYIDVYVNGLKQVVITNTKPFVIPAKGYSDAELQINISPDLIAGDLAGLVSGLLGGGAGQGNLAINLVGYVKIKEAILTISVPFSYNTTLNQILQS